MRQLKVVKPWIITAAWLAWLSSGIIIAANPQGSLAAMLFYLVLVLVLAAPSAIALALAYRRFLATWPGITGLMVAFGLISASASGISKLGATASGFATVAQLSLPFAYLASVSAFLYKRDISVSLIGGVLLIGVWMAAGEVARYRGPANFLLAYFAAAGSGGFWWWNTIATAFWCALPPIGIGFVVHFLRLLYLEWRRG